MRLSQLYLVKASLLIGIAPMPLTALAAQTPNSQLSQTGGAPSARPSAEPAPPMRSTDKDEAALPAVQPASTAGEPLVCRRDMACPLADPKGKTRPRSPREMNVAPAVSTLADAIAMAYKNNPLLLSARAQARSADFGVPVARSAYGPSLTVTVGDTFTRTKEELVAGLWAGARGWAYTASAVLTQPILTFGRNAANEQAAIASADYQREALRLTEMQVLGNVVAAYIAVRRDTALLTIARENLAILDLQLEGNRARFKYKDLTKTDLDQTESERETAEAAMMQAQGQLGVSQKQFMQYVGAPPGDLADVDLPETPFVTLADAYAYAEQNSALIATARAKERVSHANEQAARADFRPRVDAQGSFAYASNSPYNNQLRNTQVVVQLALTQPLYDSGLRAGRLQEAKETNESDWRLIDSALRDTREAVGSAWDQLAAARLSIVHFQNAMERAQSAYVGAVRQQKAGDRSTFDVLVLASNFQSMRNNYYNAVAREASAKLNLMGALGLLEARYVAPKVPLYDAQAHYDRVARRGNLPILTQVLSQVDGTFIPGGRRPRPVRDEGARQALETSVPEPAQ